MAHGARAPARSQAAAGGSRRPRPRGPHRPSAINEPTSTKRATGPETRLERALHQIPLAYEAGGDGDSDQTEAADHHRRHSERHAPAEPVQGGEIGRAEAIGDGAAARKSPALHQRMVEDVDQRAGHAGHRGEPDADAEIADLAHAGERQQALRSVWKTATSEPASTAMSERASRISVSGSRLEGEMHAEHGENEAEQHVGAHLGPRSPQEGADHRRRIGIGVGQPDMEREERELDQDAHGDEGEGGENRRRLTQSRHALGQVRDVEGAGLGLEETDPDQDQRGADGSDNEILVGGRPPPAGAAPGR